MPVILAKGGGAIEEERGDGGGTSLISPSLMGRMSIPREPYWRAFTGLSAGDFCSGTEDSGVRRGASSSRRDRDRQREKREREREREREGQDFSPLSDEGGTYGLDGWLYSIHHLASQTYRDSSVVGSQHRSQRH